MKGRGNEGEGGDEERKGQKESDTGRQTDTTQEEWQAVVFNIASPET